MPGIKTLALAFALLFAVLYETRLCTLEVPDGWLGIVTWGSVVTYSFRCSLLALEVNRHEVDQCKFSIQIYMMQHDKIPCDGMFVILPTRSDV